MSQNIFKSNEAKARLGAWYERFLARVPGPTESRTVETSFGPSHVLVAGEETRPPLVALHGSLASSAHLAVELGPLLSRHRVYFPDLPGQSVRGPTVRPSLADDGLPRWVGEVADGLGLNSFPLLGVSWGGFVARKAASFAPGRVEKLALLVPAGVVRGSVLKGLWRVGVPMLRFRLRPNEANLRKLIEPLFSVWDEDWAHYLGDAFRDFVLDFQIPPLATDAALRGLTMPVLVFAADDDISFPGRALLERISAHIPHAETELLPGCKHGPPTTEAFRTTLSARVSRFLTDPVAG
jgi:2-hydroxy-6-oxonona-2,4-dienedioate hydrolase